MSTQHHKMIILGSGPAGCTAAIYAARAGHKPALIHGMQPGGQLTITTEVENYPGFADVVQGPWLMEQMHKQAEHCGTEMITDYIKEVKLTDGGIQTLIGDSGTTYTTDALIISTGASAKWLGLESEQTYMGKGVSACATCDGSFFRNQDVAVVGGGNTAMEEAIYLAGFCKSVTMIHRRDEFRGEKILRERVKTHEKINILWDSSTEEILGSAGPLGGVEAVRVKNVKTGDTKDVAIQGIFIAIGHKPNTDLFKGQLDMDDYGYLTVPAGKVDTNLKGVYAAGDVCDDTYRQAVTAAGLGCMAALDSGKYLETKEVEQILKAG
ncbi:MAG: thioredoxin-disulfide reductase [Alphaproteobacteria bacterium]|nr:thioredoxin-disulfide reductase [Alphaproteobacteria bacterium]